MDDATLLRELEPTVETLLGRHLTTTKEWFPHEVVPYSRLSMVFWVSFRTANFSNIDPNLSVDSCFAIIEQTPRHYYLLPRRTFLCQRYSSRLYRISNIRLVSICEVFFP